MDSFGRADDSHNTSNCRRIPARLHCGLLAGHGGLFSKYWRDARDPLFLAFAAFFGIQAIDTSAVLLLPYPNEGDVWLFLMRLLSVLWVLGAILWKNSAKL